MCKTWYLCTISKCSLDTEFSFWTHPSLFPSHASLVGGTTYCIHGRLWSALTIPVCPQMKRVGLLSAVEFVVLPFHIAWMILWKLYPSSLKTPSTAGVCCLNDKLVINFFNGDICSIKERNHGTQWGYDVTLRQAPSLFLFKLFRLFSLDC